MSLKAMIWVYASCGPFSIEQILHRSRAEVQGDLAGGTSGDCLPVDLVRECRYRLVHKGEQRPYLPGDMLHRMGVLFIHTLLPSGGGIKRLGLVDCAL